MDSKQGNEDLGNLKKENAKDKNIDKAHISIFIIIISTVFIINICALAIGAVFLTNSIRSVMEDDLIIAVDIADQYVTKELELLKIEAKEAAREIDLLLSLGDDYNKVLNYVGSNNSKYTGLAIFDQLTLIHTWGDASVPSNLALESFMRVAFQGGQAVSAIMQNTQTGFANSAGVMYVSSPINKNLVLAAVLPGFYFSDIISKFTFWGTGHLFIDDEKDSVILPFQKEIGSDRGVARLKMNGASWLCAFRPISSPTENWNIGIIAPLSESALKDVPNSLLLMGAIMFVLSIGAAVAAAVLLRRPYDEAFTRRKDAEAVSLSKSTFLAHMSHEIRTPMNSIVGFSELALDGECTPRTKDYLEKIKINAQWLLQIINDILDISKVESGRMELENIPFDLRELFSSCRTLITPSAAEKGLTLYFYAEPSTGKRPLGDPSRLRQVFINLLSNAVKFTNNGMVKFLAALTDRTETTITMHFEVKDSGIGMTKEQISKIFDPFTQAEAGITRKFGGTGLGLSISKNIIDMMGGHLAVESTLGIGSKFSFDITFDTIDLTDDEMLEKKIVLNEIEKPTFEGEILLCEDNHMNQQIIFEHLSRIGINTVIADNGKIGVDLVKERIGKGKKQFDIIFMDIHMPVMDGLEAASKIMELKTGVPIIAMTANIMSNDVEIYRENGMFDCVGKPFTSQELWRCLMKYMTPIARDENEKSIILEADAEYQKMLKVYFVKSHQKKCKEIEDAIKEGDIELAHRLAHTLKGNAGQLGKTVLQKAALEVERALSQGKSLVTKEQLQTLENELNLVLNEYSSQI
ncbi:MAG: ATP-binding protein [Treponema sp.]|nr:ATP-binding protein [Treponema sp.]MCL2251916.1 ATP-binding protein [Treponema sp.]